jgi:hypothetical protein
MKPAFKWLDRRLHPMGPYLTLCLSEEEFHLVLKHLKVSAKPDWVSPGAHATMHTFTKDRSASTCVVCLDDYKGRDPAEVVGMLAHEAVHVWQEHCRSINDRAPSDEAAAYGIQSIVQELVAEFARRMK